MAAGPPKDRYFTARLKVEINYSAPDLLYLLAPDPTRRSPAAQSALLEDTFSHAGYDNPMYGHGLDLHHPDKTASDVEKAVRMAQEVWRALKRYAKQLDRCGCKEWDDPSWDQVRRFARSPGGPDTREINDQELAIKKMILGL